MLYICLVEVRILPMCTYYLFTKSVSTAKTHFHFYLQSKFTTVYWSVNMWWFDFYFSQSESQQMLPWSLQRGKRPRYGGKCWLGDTQQTDTGTSWERRGKDPLRETLREENDGIREGINKFLPKCIASLGSFSQRSSLNTDWRDSVNQNNESYKLHNEILILKWSVLSCFPEKY